MGLRDVFNGVSILYSYIAFGSSTFSIFSSLHSDLMPYSCAPPLQIDMGYPNGIYCDFQWVCLFLSVIPHSLAVLPFSLISGPLLVPCSQNLSWGTPIGLRVIFSGVSVISLSVAFGNSSFSIFSSLLSDFLPSSCNP